MGGHVIEVRSTREWNQYMIQMFTCPCICPATIVVFFADRGCPPCCTVEKIFADMARIYSTLKFLRVEVTEHMEIVNFMCVKNTPTFMFFKGGKRVDTIVGPVPAKFQQTVERLSVCPIDQKPAISCPIIHSHRIRK